MATALLRLLMAVIALSIGTLGYWTLSTQPPCVTVATPGHPSSHQGTPVSTQDASEHRPLIDDNTTMMQSWVPPTNHYDCAQRWINNTFLYDHIPSFFIPGCDNPAVYDFETWAATSRCEPMGRDVNLKTAPGAPRNTPTLHVHTAWLGPIDGIGVELMALIDSFLATQHTADSGAVLTVWFLESPPPEPDQPLRARYRAHDGTMVRFKPLDLTPLAVGTCLEGRSEFLDVNVSGVDYKRRGTMGPKEKADLARLLLLHAHGGVWVDTDSVLLRDLRPLVAFTGPNFAAKVTLSPYYNNNVLGLQKRGRVARQMLDIVCETPFTPQGRGKYCSIVGQPCYPKWYWNHGVIQLAVRRQVELVVIPWTFTDPAYSCFPPLLLSGAGGKPAKNLDIGDALEMIRGAFVLHTRGYVACLLFQRYLLPIVLLSIFQSDSPAPFVHTDDGHVHMRSIGTMLPNRSIRTRHLPNCTHWSKNVHPNDLRLAVGKGLSCTEHWDRVLGMTWHGFNVCCEDGVQTLLNQPLFLALVPQSPTRLKRSGSVGCV